MARSKLNGFLAAVGKTPFVREVPADLACCNRCRKVAGSYGGKYGEECECRAKAQDALARELQADNPGN